MIQELMDKKAAAEALGGISTVTVDRLRQTGKLPYRKIGAQVRFTPEDIEMFIEASAGTPKPKPADPVEPPGIGNRSDAVRLLAETLDAAEAGDMPFVISALKVLQDAMERYIIS
jgi:hypothetical protein